MITRRDFLKLSGLGLAASILPPIPPDEAPRTMLGRAIRQIEIYDRPSLSAKTVSSIWGETVFDIYDTVLSDDEHYNRTWYAVRRGYVYSGRVQPVQWKLQKPSLEKVKGGYLGEISVPYTSAKSWPHPRSETRNRFYYGQTHWITDARRDEFGTVWYEVADDRFQMWSWVKGEHLRRVTAEELAPIAPKAEKRIEVSLAEQTFQCFEDGVQVLDVLCSTGPYLRTENGQRVYGTPSGDHAITRKRASRHMAGDDLASDDFYDLPGVPWVSYFHWWGVSIHGTYWHNDYGRPRSHGCINLPPETAKWVYRWTLPQPFVDKQAVEGKGTAVIVF